MMEDAKAHDVVIEVAASYGLPHESSSITCKKMDAIPTLFAPANQETLERAEGMEQPIPQPFEPGAPEAPLAQIYGINACFWMEGTMQNRFICSAARKQDALLGLLGTCGFDDKAREAGRACHRVLDTVEGPDASGPLGIAKLQQSREPGMGVEHSRHLGQQQQAAARIGECVIKRAHVREPPSGRG
jgi:hypothetical protein